MTAIIKDQFRTFTVAKVMSSFFTDANTLYFGLGKPSKWNEADTPPQSIDINKSLLGDLIDHEDLIYLKKINQSSLSHSIKKRVWTQNKLYDFYRHDWNGVHKSVNGTAPNDVTGSDFYVITQRGDIYICIKNKIVFTQTGYEIGASVKSPDFGVQLVDSPASAGLIDTGDGYIWKYIASTSSDAIVNFSTRDFHPVMNVDLTALEPADAAGSKQFQSQTKSKIHRGGIYNLHIVDGGSNHVTGEYIILDAVTGQSASNADIMSVIGDGTGLKYKIIIAGGKIQDITVLDPGSGYSFANVVFKDTPTRSANILPILTSPAGLGVYPVDDLFAYNLSVSTVTNSDENGLTVDNEYRKLILLANPKVYGDHDVIFTGTYANCLWSLKLDTTQGATKFPADGVAIFTNATHSIPCRIVDYNDANKVLRVIRTRYDYNDTVNHTYDANFVVGMSMSGVADTTILDVTGSIEHPDIEPGSGTILFAEYRRALARAPRQTETHQIVIEF